MPTCNNEKANPKTDQATKLMILGLSTTRFYMMTRKLSFITWLTSSIVDNYDGDDELKSMCLTKIADIETIEEQQKDNIQNRELIIDLLNDVELGELFEEETISDDE